jgi:FMN phosphatase YigB (HAD superfamily)
MPELVSCPAPIAAALQQLRAAGWRTGIVTNGPADIQLGKIRKAGLDSLVDAWCISGDAGTRKPAPDIFRLTASRCGASPEMGGWMIGRSLPLDITGGHRAGLRTIWVCPDRGLAQLARDRGATFFTGQAPDFIADSTPGAAAILLTR